MKKTLLALLLGFTWGSTLWGAGPLGKLTPLEMRFDSSATMTYAPEIALASLFKGKPVVIDFWASWCSRCMGKLKALVELKSIVGGQADYVAINAGESDQALEKFHRKISQGKLPFAEDFKSFAREYALYRDQERELSKSFFLVEELPQIL
jgi:thiol-disulfide isomerase/thioredoxin